MGGGDHDTTSGFHSANSEGKLWDWAESIEDIGLDSHLVENLGGEKGELTGFEAVVVGDNNAHILGARDLLDKIHAEGNRGFLDGEVIHLVGAWTNEAAHTGGSEFDVFEEGGVWKQYEGGFSDYYVKRQEEQGTVPGSRPGIPAGGSSTGNPTAAQQYAQQKSASRRKKMSYREQQEYDHIDEEIAALEEQIRDLDAQMLECATQYTKLEELAKQKEEAQAQLSAKEERWLILNELAEEIAAQT